jgi:hypothetical protein
MHHAIARPAFLLLGLQGEQTDAEVVLKTAKNEEQRIAADVWS